MPAWNIVSPSKSGLATLSNPVALAPGTKPESEKNQEIFMALMTLEPNFDLMCWLGLDEREV